MGKKGGFPGSRRGSTRTHRTKTPTYEKLSKNKKNKLRKAETSVYGQYRHNDSFTAFISVLNLPTRGPWIWGSDDFTPFSVLERKKQGLIILCFFLLLRGKS